MTDLTFCRPFRETRQGEPARYCTEINNQYSLPPGIRPSLLRAVLPNSTPTSIAPKERSHHRLRRGDAILGIEEFDAPVGWGFGLCLRKHGLRGEGRVGGRRRRENDDEQ